MLFLTSEGKNGGRTFRLESDDEPFITSDLGEVAQQIVSEMPDIAQTIIHDHRNKLDPREIVLSLSPADRKDFFSHIEGCFCEEYSDSSLVGIGEYD